MQQIESQACLDDSEEHEEEKKENIARGKDLFEFVSWMVLAGCMYYNDKWSDNTHMKKLLEFWLAESSAVQV